MLLVSFRIQLYILTSGMNSILTLKPVSILTQFKSVGLLQNNILRCSLFEAKKASSQACDQGAFENIVHALSTNQPQIKLALQIRRTPHATLPQGEFSTSCSIKFSTHIRNHHLPMRYKRTIPIAYR